MADDIRADVLIIGAGVIGASIALEMTRAGHDVLVLDRSSAPGTGSTSSSAAIVRVHAGDAHTSALSDDALSIWHNWAEFLGSAPAEQIARFRRCGSLLLDPGDGSLAQIESAMTQAGVGFERWTLDDTESRFPYLDLHRFGPPGPVDDESFWEDSDEFLAGAVYTDQSGYISDPALATVNMMDAARRSGARVLMPATVASIDVHGDRVGGVTLADGTRVLAGTVVMAAGPHTAGLLEPIGATDDFGVALLRVRTEEVHVLAPPGFDMTTQGVHLVDSDLNTNFRPEGMDAFHGGSNQGVPEEQMLLDDPDDFQPVVSAEGWERLTLRLARRIPELGIPRAKSGIVGIIDAAEDWIPIYDRTRYDGLFVAAGTSGSQFKVAPLVGGIMRHIVETTLDGRDHTTVPFHSPVSDRTYSTAMYSRSRAPFVGLARL
jgi:sarcosine oxidase subunit beta